MDTAKSKLEAELKEASEQIIPGRIGIYERPGRLAGGALAAGFVGLIALVLIGLLIYVWLIYP
jgi:hypothetical protein